MVGTGLTVDCVQLSIMINTSVMSHHFSVVNKLITPVTLGIDFLQRHNLVLDFSTNPVTLSTTVAHKPSMGWPDENYKVVLEDAHQL